MTIPTTQFHARSLPRAARVSLAAIAGLALGLSSLPAAALAQEKQPDQPPPSQPQEASEAKKQMSDEAARMLKKLQEDRAKFPAEEKRSNPTVKSPAAKPVQPPATAAPKPAIPAPQPAAAITVPGKTQPPLGTQPVGASDVDVNAAAAMAAQLDRPREESFDGEMFTFDFTGEIELKGLIHFIKDLFDLQIMVQDGAGLEGQTITLYTPITIPQDKVIPFVVSLLEQRDYTMILNDMNVYVVMPKGQIPVIPGDQVGNTTRVIATPGIKPSSLAQAIQAIILRSGAGAGGSQPLPIDDLGVFIITDTPRNIEVVQKFIDQIIAEQQKVGFTRFPVDNIAAASARDGVLALLGLSSGGVGGRIPGVPQIPNAAVAGGGVGPQSNLPDRLLLDPSSNALLFRGRPDETAHLVELLKIVDIPNQLLAKWYPIGNKAAETVAHAAERLQLGTVETFESSSSEGFGGGAFGANRLGASGNQAAAIQQGLQPQTGTTLGAGFVVYPEAGGFIYRGTDRQHARVEELIRSLGPLSEFNDEIVYEFYKLRHSKSEDLANTINDLINNQTSSGNTGGLLGRDLGTGSRNRAPSATERTRALERRLAGEPDPRAAAAGASGIGEILSDDVFVLADIDNNQVIVKAPKRLQGQIKNLIDRLDLRRPQVYIEAKVVAITTGDDFRLAAEVQQVIGQWALSTNFGLSSIGDDGTITTPKNVPPGSGLTTALIRSKDVPFIINTIARDTDARVVASPQVLVDDNEEAEIESKDAQPTLTTSIGSAGQQNTQSFGGYEEAGPKLTVKPQISEGGYLRLEFEVELSSFTGESSEGSPAPKQTNRLRSDSVTVPGDSTIVVGGLTQEFKSENISGIPLLKDIPIVGELFKDTRLQRRNITLYVFITPKIMRDPDYLDLRLLTKLPLRTAKLDDEIPRALPERIDIIDRAVQDTEARIEGEIKEQKEKFDPDPPKKKYKRRPDANDGMVD